MTSEDATASGDGDAGTRRGRCRSTPAWRTRPAIYDYLLGGKDNYAADRAATEAWLKIDPGMAFAARANRAFLGRAVRYLAGEAGIRQFLDIGTGIPTAGNTHQVAQAIAPESRVVYVDYDPVVLAHARALLAATPAPPSTSTPTCATPARSSPRPGNCSTSPAGRGHAARHPARDPRLRRPARFRGQGHGRRPAGQLPCVPPLASTSCRSVRTGDDRHREPDEPAAVHARDREQVTASSRARTWWSPGWCGSRNGAGAGCRAVHIWAEVGPA